MNNRIRVGRSLGRNNNPVSSMANEIFHQIINGIVKRISWTIAKDQLQEMKEELEKMQNREGV